MDKKLQTVDTYNKSAKALADKFDSLGARISDIEETFALVNKENPNVLEIGCGNGRDAVEILKKTNHYLGIDISGELIRLAREKIPGANFEVADIASFEFSNGLDIVFAFASLIHVTKGEFKDILEKLFKSMNTGGVVRISLKHSPEYKEVTEESEFGIRTYYHYSEQDIQELVKDFSIIKSEVLKKGRTIWLEVILKKE
ncbi:MAG TPA: class I SAM-dependent methyltransferase [Candidatus Paceibacterota bacterium]